MGEIKMTTNNEISLDWLLPLEDDEQFVGGLKKDLGPNSPIGGTDRFKETGSFGSNGEEEEGSL